MGATDRANGIIGNEGFKVPVIVATTGNLLAMTGFGTTVDGVTLVAGNRVLVKDQDTASENGIYVALVGDWIRAGDWDGLRDILQGTMVGVAQGTVNVGLVFYVTTVDPVVGTTVNFAQSTVLSTSAFVATLLDDSTAAAFRTTLGLGSVSTQAANSVAITGGSIAGIDDLAIADGGTGQSTALAAFDALKQTATTSYPGVAEWATEAEVNATTSPSSSRVITVESFRLGSTWYSSFQDTTGNTSNDITGLPDWLTHFIIYFEDCSTNGTSPHLIQFGDSSSFESTGYDSVSSSMQTGVGTTAASNGFVLRYILAGTVHIGCQQFYLIDKSTNLWCQNGQGHNGALISMYASGNKALTGTLTRIRYTTAGGVNTFDNGRFRVIGFA